MDMQNAGEPTIWRWNQAPRTDAGDLNNDGPEDPLVDSDRADVASDSVATGSSWFHMKFGNRLIVTYGDEGVNPLYAMNIPSDFTDGQTGIGTNIGQIITVDGGAGTIGGSGRVAAQSTTQGRILRDTNTGGTPGEVRWCVVDENTLSPPAANTDAVYNFGIQVRTPTIGWDATRGWICTAVSEADRTQLLVISDQVPTVTTLTMPFELDANDTDRQLMWSPTRSEWLLAQTRNRAAGGLQMSLLAISGV
jgi:hypothetical protein